MALRSEATGVSSNTLSYMKLSRKIMKVTCMLKDVPDECGKVFSGMGMRAQIRDYVAKWENCQLFGQKQQ